MFGLTLNHTRAHMYRSALEGVAFAIAQHFDIYDEMGLTINKVMAVGGGTKNVPWLQMIADITGRTINTAKITIGASYGDAMLAGLAIGFYKDTKALADFVKPGMTFEPDMEKHEQYKPFRSIFDRLYPATKELMHELK